VALSAGNLECPQGQPQFDDVLGGREAPVGQLLDPAHAIHQRLAVDEQLPRRPGRGAVVAEQHGKRPDELGTVRLVIAQEGAEHVVGDLLGAFGRERPAGAVRIAVGDDPRAVWLTATKRPSRLSCGGRDPVVPAQLRTHADAAITRKGVEQRGQRAAPVGHQGERDAVLALGIQ